MVQSAILSGKPTIPVGEEIAHTEEAIAKEQAAKEAEAQANARAELSTRLIISNASSVQMDVQSRKRDDRFELDIFQGYQRTAS